MSNSTMSIGGHPDISPYWSIYPMNPTTHPMIPWKNPFDDLVTGSPVEPSLMDWVTIGELPKKRKIEVKMSKEERKLSYIKGLIEGWRTASDNVSFEAESPAVFFEAEILLSKILEVIDEKSG